MIVKLVTSTFQPDSDTLSFAPFFPRWICLVDPEM